MGSGADAKAAVDRAYIRRALELADLNAVRMTLFQHTRDPEIEALPMTAKMDSAQKELLLDKATAWLEKNAQPNVLLDEPPEGELRMLLDVATKEKTPDLEFAARRDLPAFKKFPLTVDWPNGTSKLPEGFKAIIIGSGFSGIAAGLQLGLLGIPYIVLEKRDEPGGTWSRNRYPDVRVDTASITYEFPFEKNYKWKEYFNRGEGVRAYLEHVSKKYGIYENTRFNHELKTAAFDEARNVWKLDVETPDGLQQLECNVLFSCTGLFANAKVVNFPGRDQFKGQIVHPSNWPADFDARGKRVAIIGNGSTGVQLLGPIAEDASQVHVFQRTQQWIAPRAGYGKAIEPEVQWVIDNFPGYWNWARYFSMAALFQTHDFLFQDKEWQAKGGTINQGSDALRDLLINYIKTETGGRQDLIDKLIPDYAPWSRRPVVDNGWYRALTRDNVELVTDSIERFTENGVMSADGKVREADIIVTATGFEVERFLAPAAFKGVGGVDIHQKWEAGDGARAYLSILAPEFPNLFMIYGPNSQPVSGGTGLPMWYLMWSAYAAQCIMRMVEEGKSRVEVKQEAHDRYNAALDKEASQLIQMSDKGGFERNYYVSQKHNRLQANAPWYGPNFQKMCSKPDWDDLELS